jgi:hypothetical protein
MSSEKFAGLKVCSTNFALTLKAIAAQAMMKLGDNIIFDALGKRAKGTQSPRVREHV